MIIDEKTKRYIKEVYYYDDSEYNDTIIASNDIIELLEGTISIEQLRQKIADAKMNDEKEYGDDIYKKE